MRSLSLRAAVATRMRLWDQIRRALCGPRQTQNLDLRPARDPNQPRKCRRSVKRNPDAFQDDAWLGMLYKGIEVDALGALSAVPHIGINMVKPG